MMDRAPLGSSTTIDSSHHRSRHERLLPTFDSLCVNLGRPSVSLECVLRALLLQILHSSRSERLRMEQLDYNISFRWFVGLSMDEPI